MECRCYVPYDNEKCAYALLFRTAFIMTQSSGSDYSFETIQVEIQNMFELNDDGNFQHE